MTQQADDHNVNLGGIGVALVLGAGVIVIVRQAGLLWVGSDRFRFRDSMPPGMPMSPAFWNHYVRSLPVLAAASVSFAGAVLIAAVANGLATVILATASLLLLFGVAPVIILFNRPKALVPPSCRGRVGWIAEQRGKGAP